MAARDLTSPLRALAAVGDRMIAAGDGGAVHAIGARRAEPPRRSRVAAPIRRERRKCAALDGEKQVWIARRGHGRRAGCALRRPRRLRRLRSSTGGTTGAGR